MTMADDDAIEREARAYFDRMRLPLGIPTTWDEAATEVRQQCYQWATQQRRDAERTVARTNALRERLAALEHDQWSGWMMWLFKRSTLHADGSVTIPPDLVARWKRQMLTDYAALSEDEQRSDLVEADKVLAVLEEMGR